MAREILIGNCLNVMAGMPDESVDCIVTSPPYWALRDYGTEPQIWPTAESEGCDHEWVTHIEQRRGGSGINANVRANRCNSKNNRDAPTISDYCAKCNAWKGQLGLEPRFQEYIDHLIMIFDQAYRILKPTGACWVNLGDTYNGYKVSNDDPKASAKSNTLHVKHINDGIKRKCLLQIPSRFAIAMTERGWILRNEIIWHKPNAMPSAVKDRLTVDFEKMFFFTKNEKYYFEQQKVPLRAPKRYANPKTTDKFSTYDARNTGGYVNMRTVWSINTRATSEAHIAMFPIDLAEIPIKATCPPGGTVLDPFCGSGTVLQYCFFNNIDCIGIDVNPDYKEIIERRGRIHMTTLNQYAEE